MEPLKSRSIAIYLGKRVSLLTIARPIMKGEEGKATCFWFDKDYNNLIKQEIPLPFLKSKDNNIPELDSFDKTKDYKILSDYKNIVIEDIVNDVAECRWLNNKNEPRNGDIPLRILEEWKPPEVRIEM